MTDIPLTDLELRAQKAGDFAAFPINLHNVRDTVSSLLNEVGRYGFFDEYTDHSFRHVLGMLKTAEWIIPETTKPLLTPADWLFLVLSIYFHDVGLLISRNEYENRSQNPEFAKFKAAPPIPLPKYIEFTARLQQLPLDQRERILYQEFVRFSHGQRIKAWIEGAALDDNNSAIEIRRIISGLFVGLDLTVKRDLGLACESHTKDDIADTRKYKVSQPYGASANETVNLQYIAAILRTVDLLQITKGRAPSVLFQIISPTDPVSQLEWQKQGAVRSVRAKPGTDREGKASLDVQSDTIEVHARFGQADGFFGLTSYLAYAERELQACQAAILKSGPLLLKPPSYPWKFIDSSGVEAAGFLTESFGFSLDQQKILDLLTGHTLYNDTSVVLRELTQNALDAVRLQAELDGHVDAACGSIAISWNSSDRVLTVADNGTGISQETIVNHLLKVGSSRYQAPLFKERFPNFCPISRFGIGVLSTFMVSDNVQITTCSADDDQARRIEFRSVHGKYLIKLLDKVSDREEIGVYPHGTSVRLTLRPTANIGNVLKIASMWLMFPKCRVTVKIDSQEPVIVGYDSPRDAIEKYLASSVRGQQRYRQAVSVREFEEKGVTLAFAVRKSELFKEWGFVGSDERNRDDEDDDRPPIGVCIEGVGVEFNTPGFQTPSIIAVSNAVGPSAPKTNVARSALEDTVEQREMLRTVCRLYARHVSEEIMRLASEEGYSLSRAVGEAPYISEPLWTGSTKRAYPALMEEAIAQIPMIIVENNSERVNIYPDSLRIRENFLAFCG
jgi:molecular chaperone HtpG